VKVKEKSEVNTTCYHCGEDVVEHHYHIEDKEFCCKGCQTVYEIINKSDLCSYYDLEHNPGINQKQEVRKGKFDFLDDNQIIKKLTHFQDDTHQHVIFYLPQMHCASCIWILEHLDKIDSGIIKSQVNFVKKEVTSYL
jgi:Cu+-exporting ATPase